VNRVVLWEKKGEVSGGDLSALRERRGGQWARVGTELGVISSRRGFGIWRNLRGVGGCTWAPSAFAKGGRGWWLCRVAQVIGALVCQKGMLWEVALPAERGVLGAGVERYVDPLWEGDVEKRLRAWASCV